MSTIDIATLKRGDIWLVSFDQTRGSEISKTRPAVIISSDAVGILPVKLVAPLTGWDSRYERNIWHVKVNPTCSNGLTKPSAVDALQIRGVSVHRFVKRLGKLPASSVEEITAAIAAVVEYE